jgi:hypothetical protein
MLVDGHSLRAGLTMLGLVLATLAAPACGARTELDVVRAQQARCPAPDPIVLLHSDERLYHLALDRDYVYVAEEAVVRRVNKCGGVIQTVAAGALQAFDLAVWEGDVYFSNQYLGGNVSRVPVTGGTPRAVLQTMSQPEGIAVGGGFVYAGILKPMGGASWDLYSAPANGGVATVRADAVPRYPAADDRYAYAGGADLRRIPHGGGPAEVLIAGATARDLTVDDAYVYWTAEQGSSLSLRRADKRTGANPTVLYVTTNDFVFLAAEPIPLEEGGRVYFSSQALGRVLGVAKDGSSVVTVTDDAPTAEDVGADESSVYWISFENGTLNRRDRP